MGALNSMESDCSSGETNIIVQYNVHTSAFEAPHQADAAC